jgi:MoxR-like ATPase
VTAWIAGRSYLVPEDVRAVFAPVIAHRLVLQPVHELRRAEFVPPLVDAILAKVAAP